MLIDRNQLPEPEAVERPDFEQYFQSFASTYVAELKKIDADLATEVEETLKSKAELFTKMAENFCLWSINYMERGNEQVRQVLPAYARDNNLEHVVSLMGIERQTIKEGDPDAYPPVPDVLEDDDSLLRRFWLAPHAPSAGSRLGYRFHALTLDERPIPTLEKSSPATLVLTYTLNPSGYASQIKDSITRRTSPTHVKTVILSNTGNGVPGAELLTAVRNYFDTREDTKPETDEQEVVGATLQNYTISATVQVADGPDLALLKQAMTAGVQTYADEEHRLSGSVQPTRLDQILHNNGAKKIISLSPASPIETDYTQAPYCTSITINLQVV